MPIAKRVSVIMPFDQALVPQQNALKWGIVEEIEALGYSTEIFLILADARLGRSQGLECRGSGSGDAALRGSCADRHASLELSHSPGSGPSSHGVLLLRGGLSPTRCACPC